MLLVLPYGYDMETREGRDEAPVAWANVAIAELMAFVKEHIQPFTTGLQTLQLVVPERFASAHYSDNWDGKWSFGRRDGGYPVATRYVRVDAKIAKIKAMGRKITAKLTTGRNAALEAMWNREWKWIHDRRTLVVLDEALQRWRKAD